VKVILFGEKLLLELNLTPKKMKIRKNIVFGSHFIWPSKIRGKVWATKLKKKYLICIEAYLGVSLGVSLFFFILYLGIPMYLTLDQTRLGQLYLILLYLRIIKILNRQAHFNKLFNN